MIGNNQFVAKELVDIGHGRGRDITAEKSASFLLADLIRIKRMNYFAAGFGAHADREGAEIECELPEFECHSSIEIISRFPSVRSIYCEDL